MVTTVSDLDALVLRCRSKRARSYIAEAVVCLKVGACRAAIVITWIAVVHDLIEKFDELALGGDKNARSKVDAFRKSVEAHDTATSLAFERAILENAHKEFELFGPLALVDLQRLRDDRHRCAHPSMLDGASDYQPPPELARYHVISAITHLLEHGPAQGTAALERLTAEIDKEYFPDTVEKLVAHLSQGPLKHPRASLVRNFVIVVLKRYLAANEWASLSGPDAIQAWSSRERFQKRAIPVLRAMLNLHYEGTMDALAEKLDALVANAPDQQRQDVLDLLVAIPDLWSLLSIAQRNRMAAFVEYADRWTVGQAMRAAWALPELRAIAAERLKAMPAAGWSGLADSAVRAPDEWLDAAIAALGAANTWSSANGPASLLQSCVAQLSEAQVKAMCAALQGHDDRKTSFGVRGLLEKLATLPGFGPSRLKQLLVEAGPVEEFENQPWWPA